MIRVAAHGLPALAGVAVWGAALLLLVVYFLPTVVGRHKRNVVGIFALNLLFGWTVVGWLGALLWAATAAED